MFIKLCNKIPSKIGLPNYQESIAYRGTWKLLCDKLLVPYIEVDSLSVSRSATLSFPLLVICFEGLVKTFTRTVMNADLGRLRSE